MLFAMVAVGSVVGIALLISSKAPAPGADLADLLNKNPQDYDFSLGPFFGSDAGSAWHVSSATDRSHCVVVDRRERESVVALPPPAAVWKCALTAMMVGLLFCVHSAFVIFSPVLSSKPLATAIQKRYQPGDLIVIDGQYHQASTLNFYLGMRIRVLHAPSGNLWYGVKFPDAHSSIRNSGYV